MFKLITCFLVIFICTVKGQVEKKLDIGLFYEDRCRDSYKFVRNQIDLVYDYVKDYVNILYVPFGKAWYVSGDDFECQHGIEECNGNKMQSCALHLLNGDQRLQTEFVVCQMRANEDDTDRTGQVCSEFVGLDFLDVQQCFENMATSLQLDAEILTNAVAKPLKFVPTIVYNDVFDQDLQDRTIMDFLKVLCEQLVKLGNSKMPIVCTDPY